MEEKKRSFWIEVYYESRQEIRKWGWFASKGELMSSLLAIAVILLGLWKWHGLKFALDTLWSGFWPNILVAIILFLLLPGIAIINIFWLIPKQDRSKQARIDELEKKSEDILDIVVVPDFAEDIIDSDGKTRKYLTLGIINGSKTFKITEFGVDAMLTASHQVVDGEVLSNAKGAEKLLWLEERKELIEIRPNNTAYLIVAFLEGNTVATRGVKYEGKDEIVFQLILFFSGKFEGETRFRNHLEYRGIYCSPVEKRLEFTHIAIHNSKHIDPKLLEAMVIMNKGELYINS